ncbi:unnamed protein product [Rotaria magnacalcarata]|uniref:DYW domain-containing protein n=2 Tax=Rotaria magnacalcarata TaxID=392030 RepID=A0A820A1L3_9BILA|nr:unnamed protein product [Rotaria magnacalcarata]CAF1215948.1 unnamed protein product [Rotaria magnacalcarata]CAF1925444.1 unnamed protein product [Rotaria magnacalcarata]CAF2083798.1 unnamed protein product [Rotaria magnacalcarata]CAF3826103.1 unnamed protein product [Rotaria magnacalcarata]
MKKLIESQQYRQALDLVNRQRSICDQITFNLALKACTKLNDYQYGIRIHQQLSLEALENPFIQTSLIHFYMQCHDIDQAHKIFSTIKNKTASMYGAMFKGYISNNMPEKVTELFEKISIEINEVVITMLFNACAKLCNSHAIKIGRDTLNRLPTSFLRHSILVNSAIDMLMKFGDVNRAEVLFEKIKKKDIVTYGAMMQGYVTNNLSEKALDLFEKISMKPNEVLSTIVFNACASLSNEKAVQLGKKIFDEMPKGYLNNIVLVTSAIDMFMKFGEIESAEYLFSQIKQKNSYSYGAMMQGYVKNNLSEKALDLFEKIPMKPTDVLYTIVYNACASLSNEKAVQLGKKIFDEMPKGYLDNIVLVTSVMHMFMKFGEIEIAEDLFSKIKQHSPYTYGVMIHGYKTHQEPQKCLSLFEQMKKENLTIDEAICVALVGACSQIGIRSICQNIVRQIALPQSKIYVQNALIDMWGKSGDIDQAKQIFQSISQPEIITYNSMINAYARNGMGYEAINLYNKIPENIRDKISHICVLNACSHSGLIDQAQMIFNKIDKKSEEIVTTMIDCLSRMAMFDQAQQLIDDYEKSNSPYLIMYSAILSGARNHRHIALSEEIFNQMRLLFPNEKSALISASVLLSNTYSSLGNDQQVEAIRMDRIKELGKNVKVGVSWTEVNGQLVRFQAHDRSHPQSDKIYAELERLSNELREHGHEYDSTWVTRPLKTEETIESALCGHSEKLAIAFNFIQYPRPSFIQITKNLRVCGDCHRATKLIAKIRQCEIIVRDANRIHHFHTNGQCSCQDHF